MRPATACCLAIVLSAAPASAGHATKVRTIEGITEYQLDNGLQVLLAPDASVATVTVDTVIHAGARNEGYGEAGMAHLLEHMAFKGSPRHPHVWEALEARGASTQDGTTSHDATQFYATLAASQDNLDYALDLYADVMVNASISDDELRSEVTVVRNEVELRDAEPSWILGLATWAAAYRWHAYGRSVLGSRLDVERVPGGALRAFHTRYYQPDNATLIVAGRFEVPAALASIERTFGAIPKPTRALPTTVTIEPPQDGEHRVTVERVGDQYLLHIAYHMVSGASPDLAVFDATGALLAHAPSGRLYKKLVETGLATDVSWEDDAYHDPGMMDFTATVSDPKNADKVEQIMVREIEGLGASKLDDDALAGWKIRTRKSHRQLLENTTNLATSLWWWIGVGDWRLAFAYYDAADRTTAADVARVASAYFTRSNRTVGRFVPTPKPVRAPLTETANVAAAAAGVHEGAAGTDGEVFAATLDNIDARTQRGALAGGAIQTALLVKKTRRQTVQLRLALHWGDDKTLRDLGAAPLMLGDLMNRGTLHKSYAQLRDAKDRLEADISISTQPTGLTLTIDSVHDQLGPALALALEMMTEPALTQAHLDVARREWADDLAGNLQDPGTAASDVYWSTVTPYAPGDPRHYTTTQERIDQLRKLTLGDVARFAKAFAGASHGELVVVGDFDAAAISAQIEALAKKWPSRAPYTRLSERTFGVAGSKKIVPLADKTNAEIELGHEVALRETDPDFPAMVIANAVLGSGFESRLWKRIREHEGLSYGVHSAFWADDREPSAQLQAWAIVAPQNMAKIEASLVDELRKLAAGPITADEVARAKDAWRKQRDTELADDSTVVAMLANQLYKGRTMDWSRQLRAKIAALTAADVERAAKAYVSLDHLTVVEALDPAKAAAPAVVAPGR